MALISDGKFVENDWRHLADEEDLPKAGKIIVSRNALGRSSRGSCPPTGRWA